jgi:hypothetical protein
MIAHDDVAEELPVAADDRLLETVDQPTSVGIIADDLLPGVAPRHHVIDGTLKLAPKSPWRVQSSDPRQIDFLAENKKQPDTAKPPGVLRSVRPAIVPRRTPRCPQSSYGVFRDFFRFSSHKAYMTLVLGLVRDFFTSVRNPRDQKIKTFEIFILTNVFGIWDRTERRKLISPRLRWLGAPPRG